jgi:Asp-tRNA(Asn)/Glu-tRNA(Gln) amidotransferase A subunit family amidase
MEGLPVEVQIIGEAWGEERVLAIMHVVDAAHGFGPGTWGPGREKKQALGLIGIPYCMRRDSN